MSSLIDFGSPASAGGTPHEAERERLLAGVAGELLRADDPRRVIEGLALRVMHALGCDLFLHYLLDEGVGTIRLAASAGVPESATRGELAELPLGERICGQVARDGVRRVLERLDDSALPEAAAMHALCLRAYVCAPLLGALRRSPVPSDSPAGVAYAPREVLGTLSFGSRSRDTLTPDDLLLVDEVADLVSLAVERGRDRRRLTETARRLSEQAQHLLEQASWLVDVRQSADRARLEAEEANRTKDQFLAVLSHELRAPLTPVLAATHELELDLRLPPEVRETLGIVRRNAELEAKLIDDLLDLTRVSRGRLELCRAEVCLATATREAASLCEVDARAAGVTIVLAIPPGRVLLRADPVRLRQVLWNMIKNAVKFTPAGGRVDILVAGGPTPDSPATVEVVDTGIGIAPEAMHRIFSAFEQADAAVTRRFGGLGLGLAISRAIAELHGGHLEARSDGPGRGATFRLTLPGSIRLPDTTPVALPPPPAEPPRQLSVLLVDDHADTSRVLGRLLSHMGYRVSIAASVATGVAAFQAGRPDVLISDVGLPDGTGHDLLRALLALGSHVNAIALSGFGMEEDIQSSLRAGFARHLTKPIDVRRLDQVIREVTGSHATPA